MSSSVLAYLASRYVISRPKVLYVVSMIRLMWVALCRLNTLANMGSWPFLSVAGLAELYPKGPGSIETASFCLSTSDVTCRPPSIMHYVCPTPADPVRWCIHHLQKGVLPKIGPGLRTQPTGLDLSLNLDYHPGGTLQVSYGYVSSTGSI